MVGTCGAFVSSEAPAAVITLSMASSYTLFLVDYQEEDLDGVAFDPYCKFLKIDSNQLNDDDKPKSINHR